MTGPIETNPADVRCPECGYSPIDEARESGEGWDLTTEPTTREWALEFYDVLLADEGNVICQVCACEFRPPDIEEVVSQPKQTTLF